MFGIRRNSLTFKTALIYIMVTILNITVFITMVFENQQDLISDNAVLTSEMQGINLKFRIEGHLAKEKALTEKLFKAIVKEAKFLGIREIALFKGNGMVWKEVKAGKIVRRKKAKKKEIEWINKAITRNTFEDKVFAHRILKDEKKIELYVPVSYGVDNYLILRPVIKMTDIEKQMGFLYKQCVLMGLILVIIHFAMGYFFSKIILVPLSQLSLATDKITSGDLSQRVEIVRDDEIGQLAISFNEMTVSLSRMQDEAKGANPLSGLPGNITIVNEIQERLTKSEKFAVLYCDLDNFKAYNDKYGFTKGDQVILFVRDCLQEAGKKKGDNRTFLGHEGGDDFVAIASIETWEEISKTFIANLDYGISQFYNETDAKNRFIESVNRQGVPMRFPLISVSVAIVSNERRKFEGHAQIVSIATEMKKFVKGKEGSCYAIDRRVDDTKRQSTPANEDRTLSA